MIIMKKIPLLLLSALLLVGCSCANNGFNPDSNNEQTDNDDTPTDDPVTPPDAEETDNSRIDHITLNKSNEILQINKKLYLTVDFYPTDENDNIDDLHDGSWSSSNSNIASVSQYCVVTGVSVGQTIITFTTVEGSRRANCIVYVVEDASSVTREYQRVDDVETISDKDIIVFGCPEANLTASITRKDGYLVPVTSSYSSDKRKITVLGEGTGEYLVSVTEDGLTLENQENEYLCAKYLKNITFVKNKGPITWAFEYIDDQEGVSVGNYVYSTYDSIEGWLMFNTKANRFTLYDSNTQVDMFLPTIYRLTVVL